MSEKLTQTQIQFINDYLIRNKVKFWDIRMELLDHIALDVQERMKNGQDFDTALKAVHLSFGNKKKSRKLSKDQKQWIFTESIYADHSGFKKLLVNKQKEGNARVRKLLRKTIIKLFKNPIFLLCYLITGLTLFRIIAVSQDYNFVMQLVLIPLLIFVCVPLIMSLNYFKKVHRHSMHLNLLATLPILGPTLLNSFIYIPKLFWEPASTENSYKWAFCVFFLIITPIIIGSITLYSNQLKEYRKLYLKWKTVN